MYRKLSSLRGWRQWFAPVYFDARQTESLRYSRLKVCVTGEFVCYKVQI